MVQEYDKLMNERQYLEKELAKIEFRVERKEKEKMSPFHFMLDVWRWREEGEISVEERLDWLNKSVIKTKQGITDCIAAEKD